MKKTIFLVQINYKSGKTIEMWFENFEINTKNGEIVGAEWKDTIIDNKKIIYLGLNNIESIFQIDEKEIDI